MHTAMAEITEHDVTVEMLRHDKEALEFDITHCRFAEFFRALGEPELGALLICETDFDIAAAGDGLKIDDLEDLKGYLVSIVIAVLAVLFLRQAVERAGDLDLLKLSAVAALVLFLSMRIHRKE
jgi:hypothetical protein